MDLTTLLDSDDSVVTAGGLADHDTAVSADPVLWGEADDMVFGCSAPAGVAPRALDHRGDVTEESVQLTGRLEAAYPVPALPAQLAMR